MPLGSNYPKICTQTQEDEKETRMRGRKRVEGRERISQEDNKMGGIAAETKVWREGKYVKRSGKR